jgi:hypothetical protein
LVSEAATFAGRLAQHRAIHSKLASACLKATNMQTLTDDVEKSLIRLTGCHAGVGSRCQVGCDVAIAAGSLTQHVLPLHWATKFPLFTLAGIAALPQATAVYWFEPQVGKSKVKA